MTGQSKIVGMAGMYKRMLDISRATFYRCVLHDPSIPMPLKAGLHKNAWFRGHAEAWIEQLAAGVAA